MYFMKQAAQLVIRVVMSVISLVVLLGVGLVAFGALVMATLAVFLRIKWLQRKFSKQSDPHLVDAEKTADGQYTVSGL